MSTSKKLRGGSESELTKLKVCWRGLSESARDFWRALLVSDTTLPQIRAQISTKLKINLTRDNQLSGDKGFCKWLDQEDARQSELERQLSDERAVLEEHPDWSKDQAREEVLKRSYFRTLATGDFKLGLKTVKADQNERVISLDERRLKLLEKKAEQADAARGILENKELSEEQKRSRMREVFGLA